MPVRHQKKITAVGVRYNLQIEKIQIIKTKKNVFGVTVPLKGFDINLCQDILIFYDSLFCNSESIHYIPLIENILNIMVLILLLRCISLSF